MKSKVGQLASSLTRLRALLLALALGAGATLLATPAPAQAGPPPCDGILIPIMTKNGLEYFCLPLYYRVDPEIGPEPCYCPDIAMNIVINPVLPEDAQRGFVDAVGQGLSLLGQAAGARDAGELLGRAEEAFGEAARLLGDSEVRLGEVGSVDPRSGTFIPEPTPWFERVGTELVEGLDLMRRGFCDPEPEPWFRAAMDKFAAVQAGLAAHAPVGV